MSATSLVVSLFCLFVFLWLVLCVCVLSLRLHKLYFVSLLSSPCGFPLSVISVCVSLSLFFFSVSLPVCPSLFLRVSCLYPSVYISLLFLSVSSVSILCVCPSISLHVSCVSVSVCLSTMNRMSAKIFIFQSTEFLRKCKNYCRCTVWVMSRSNIRKTRHTKKEFWNNFIFWRNTGKSRFITLTRARWKKQWYSVNKN